MLRIALVLVAALLVFAAPTFAQDATVVDSDHYVVEFENDEVRLLRITYGPNEKSVMHAHPDAIAIMLSGGDMLMHLPDGSTQPSPMEAGQAFWTPAVTHQPENLTDKKVVVILVEMKDDVDDDDDGDR
jgi:quercetin dioxygenase-like cupin family protein